MREVSFLLLPSLQEWYFLPVYNYVSKPQNSVFNSPCVLWKVVWLMLIEISLWGAVVFHGLEFCWVGRLCLFIVVEEGHLSVLKCFWGWLNRSVLRTSIIVRTGERWLINHQKICCNVSCKNGCFLDSSRLEKVRSRYVTQIIETESTEPDAILYTSLAKLVGW